MKWIIFSFLFFACGDSPFLDKSDPDDISVAKKYHSTLYLSEVSDHLRRSSSINLDQQIHLKAIWNLEPQVGPQSALIVTMFNQGGEFIDLPLRFEAYLWMPNMGHGSFPISIKKMGSGFYELSELYFTMPGLWNLHLEFYEDETLVGEILWPIEL